MTRHEIPTHLNVEDKAFYGLSVRQVMTLIVGLSAAYGLWNQALNLPLPLRLGLALACTGLAVCLAFIRPYGRGLEEWAFVALHYAAMPKVSVWRPREPEANAWQASAGDWEEFAPSVAWKEDAG